MKKVFFLLIAKAIFGIDNCPPIQDVQREAIRFANLSPKKIKQLKRYSRYKALLPKVTLSCKKTIYGSAKENVIITGPNDWEFSFTWNLDELIYNPDIKEIDDKERYITRLRNEIIKDVTKLYFERKRLIEKGSDPLLIEELEALIDGYTGGWFLKCLKK